jgi:formylglycine-generating enzyme required for sulfatase activity
VSSPSDFFQVGGTLDEDSPSYIERPADKELMDALERGEVCLVLAPRQTGKSSLMVHARSRLRRRGAAAAIVDLQPLGSHSDLDAWFRDVVYQIQRSLGLASDSMEWWEAHRSLGPTQRFMTFIEDVVLAESEGRVVIFFDEIDSVLHRPFSDDFFTTLRSLFNARASNPKLKRISFVMMGVADPSQFIKSRSRTPFNIGRQIELRDFDSSSLALFKEVLGSGSEPVVDRIFYWTAGQPLMVQKLAQAAYSRPAESRTPAQVDEAVKSVYLEAKIEKDTHLKFVRNYLLEGNKRLRRTLKTYRDVLENKEVPYDGQSPVHARLKLAGVVQSAGQKLVPRNRIYQQVFGLEWVKANTPRDIVKLVAYGSSAALLLVLMWFFLVQPLFFPKFNSYQTQPWFSEEIIYTEDSTLQLTVPLPKVDIRKIELDGREIPQPPIGGERKIESIPISLSLPLGASNHALRFYGPLWKENFERRLVVVSYPMSQWKISNIETVWVSAGCFEMGCGDWDGECEKDENPVHKVCLDGFEIGKTEVTQEQWKGVMGFNPSYFDRGGNYPVENVSWENAEEFIRRLNKLTGKRFGLPTEAQWEYAARSGGKQQKYAGGNNLDSLGWYSNNSNFGTHPVGQKDANGLDIHDMSGNVWEWCQDWYGIDFYEVSPERNPKGPETGSRRVIRGGGWINDAQNCRSARRIRIAPDDRNFHVGFRLSRSVSLGP